MEFSHGKHTKETDSEKDSTLATLLGMGGNNPFETLDREVFLDKLDRMTLEERGNLACKLDVRPNPRGNSMRDGLIAAFDRYVKNSSKKYLDSGPSKHLEHLDPAYKDLL